MCLGKIYHENNERIITSKWTDEELVVPILLNVSVCVEKSCIAMAKRGVYELRLL